MFIMFKAKYVVQVFVFLFACQPDQLPCESEIDIFSDIIFISLFGVVLCQNMLSNVVQCLMFLGLYILVVGLLYGESVHGMYYMFVSLSSV